MLALTAQTSPTPAHAGRPGAGQTADIVNAHHNPNAAAKLAAFNTKFGLPACTTKALATNTTLPLASASTTACEFLQVFASPAGTMSANAPAYEASWANEIALDAQWVARHRAAGARGADRSGRRFDQQPGRRHQAGQSPGAGVSWPSASANVVAVGGTRLNYSASGVRSEVAGSGTGGGVSAFTAIPGYQHAAVPGLSGIARRAVADVAFNADPSTGQCVAVMAPGSTTASWMSAGGTSLSTTQRAGLMAVANGQRALTAKLPLGAPHAVLDRHIGAVPGNYASALADTTQAGPVIASSPLTGVAGKALSGSYTMKVLVTDVAGLSAAANIPVTITAK